jgi:hypothetical protein
MGRRRMMIMIVIVIVRMVIMMMMMTMVVMMMMMLMMIIMNRIYINIQPSSANGLERKRPTPSPLPKPRPPAPRGCTPTIACMGHRATCADTLRGSRLGMAFRPKCVELT